MARDEAADHFPQAQPLGIGIGQGEQDLQISALRESIEQRCHLVLWLSAAGGLRMEGDHHGRIGEGNAQIGLQRSAVHQGHRAQGVQSRRADHMHPLRRLAQLHDALGVALGGLTQAAKMAVDEVRRHQVFALLELDGRVGVGPFEG